VVDLTFASVFPRESHAHQSLPSRGAALLNLGSRISSHGKGRAPAVRSRISQTSKSIALCNSVSHPTLPRPPHVAMTIAGKSKLSGFAAHPIYELDQNAPKR